MPALSRVALRLSAPAPRRLSHLSSLSRLSWTQLGRCLASRPRPFESGDLEISRHSVFGAAREDDACAAAVPQHTYGPSELVWRSQDLQLHEATRAGSEVALRKKLRHHARARGWMEAAEFLVGFVDACGESLDAQELRDWERLMACDDMFLMRLVAERTAAPPELDTPLLQKLRGHFASAGPSHGLVVE